MQNRYDLLSIDEVQHVNKILLSLHRGSVQLDMLDEEGSGVDAAPATAQVSVKRDACVVSTCQL